MSKNRTYTPEEAEQIAKAYFAKRVTELAKSLENLQAQELAKAVVPTHAGHTGMSTSPGTEDVAAGKLGKEELCKDCGKTHELGKCWKKELGKSILKDGKGKVKDTGIHPDSVLPDDKSSEELSAGGSGGEIKKGKKLGKAEEGEVCKDCGKKHAMDKSGRCWEGYKPVPGKEPYSKGSCEPVKKADPMNNPWAATNATEKPKPQPKPQPKPVKKDDELGKGAMPPVAKPPSGQNMGTAVPASKPAAAPKMAAPKPAAPGAPAMKDEMSAEESSSPGKEHEESSVEKSEALEKAAPARPPLKVAMTNDKTAAPAVRSSAAPAPKIDSTKGSVNVMGAGGAQPTSRANFMAQAGAGAFNPTPGAAAGHGLELARKPNSGPKTMLPSASPKPAAKPGIFGRLASKMGLGKGEMDVAADANPAPGALMDKAAPPEVKAKIKQLAAGAPKPQPQTPEKMQEVKSKIRDLAAGAPPKKS